MKLGNAYTAAMSNAVSLRLGDVTALLHGTALGALPTTNSRLRLFLHEGTHHTSLSGAYGWASAALASSVVSSGLVGPVPRDDNLFLPARDLLVLRWTQCVFQPLLEGLAVFAEHDIAWGEGDFASQPLLNAVSLYLARDAFSEAAPAEFDGPFDQATLPRAAGDARLAVGASIDGHLKSARSSPYWIAEKEALLRQPLLGSDGIPAYLLGYLAVKRAFLRTRRADAARSDPDGFLLIMLHHWFWDKDIARAMLDVKDLHPIQAQLTLSSIGEQFQDRWEELYRSPKTAAASALAYLSADREAGAFGDLELLVGVRTLEFGLTHGIPSFFKHRLVLRHGAHPVSLSVDRDAREVSVKQVNGGAALFYCPLVPNADSAASIGTIELVRSVDGRFNALVVLGSDGLLAAWDLDRGAWNPPDIVEVFDDLPSGEQARDAEMAVQRTHWDETWKRPGLADLYNHQLTQAKELHDSVYLQIAFPGSKLGERERIASILGGRGFAQLFEEPSALHRVAQYSLEFGGRGAPIADVAAATGTTSETLLAEVSSLNSKARSVLGVDLFEATGRDWLTSAV